MVIIPREELDRSASGLHEGRKTEALFDRWLASASGRTTPRANADLTSAAVTYKQHASWRLE